MFTSKRNAAVVWFKPLSFGWLVTAALNYNPTPCLPSRELSASPGVTPSTWWALNKVEYVLPEYRARGSRCWSHDGVTRPLLMGVLCREVTLGFLEVQRVSHPSPANGLVLCRGLCVLRPETSPVGEAPRGRVFFLLWAVGHNRLRRSGWEGQGGPGSSGRWQGWVPMVPARCPACPPALCAPRPPVPPAVLAGLCFAVLLQSPRPGRPPGQDRYGICFVKPRAQCASGVSWGYGCVVKGCTSPRSPGQGGRWP